MTERAEHRYVVRVKNDGAKELFDTHPTHLPDEGTYALNPAFDWENGVINVPDSLVRRIEAILGKDRSVDSG